MSRFDDVELLALFLGIICFVLYGTIVPDERVLMTGLAIVSTAVGINQRQRRKNG